MSNIYVKSGDFEIRIEDVDPFTGSHSDDPKINPILAELIDELTKKFSLSDAMNEYKLAKN